MKSITSYTKNIKDYCAHLLAILLVATVSLVSFLFFNSNASALDLSDELALSDEEYRIYSQNNIIFPTDDCVSTSGPSSICGDTAEEMYWSALSQFIDDPVKVAGVIGNLMNEGGMNPVAWEGSITKADGSLDYDWNHIYGGGLDGNYGVGAFGITSGLSTYLHFVNDNAPDLIKYFQNAKEYNFNYIHPGSGANPTYGDTLLEKIGKDEFAKLVEIEVKYAMEKFNPPRTQGYMEKNFSSPSEAAYWWMDEWERPAYRNNEARESAAEKAYDEFKNFTCTPSSSSSAPTGSATVGINSNITLIGDSIAVQAESELQSKFPGAFMTKVGSRHSTSGGTCEGDEGGFETLRKIISATGTVVDQSSSGTCTSKQVNKDSITDNIVWELGTNSNGASKETVENVIKTIGQRKLFLVTPYNGQNMEGADAIAEMYRKMADEHDTVYVVDWNKAVRDDASKYVTTADGMAVHPTVEGRQLLATLISEAVESTAGCAMANTYKDSAYKKRLEQLDNFNQWRGRWKDVPMCANDYSATMSNAGCGIMSMYGMYYMFTGKGLDDSSFNEFLEATRADNYNACGSGSAASLYGAAMEKFTGLTMNNEDALWVGRSYNGDSDWATLVDTLKKGKKILIGTTGVACGGDSLFGYCGHYLFLDHYNAEKDEILLFDPSMSPSRAEEASEVGPTGDLYDGVYINKATMAQKVVPDEARPVTYYGQDCAVCESGSTGLIAGGMTYEQAVKFMEPYVKEAEKELRGNYGLSAGRTAIGDGLVSDAGCSGGTLNNCVAFSQWFVNNYTTIDQGIGTNDGVGYAGTLIHDGGLTDGGTTPRAYAVFSVAGPSIAGHTGVVLGINKDKGEIYIGEAACSSGFTSNWPGVHIYGIDEYAGGAYHYAYTDSKLKTSDISR